MRTRAKELVLFGSIATVAACTALGGLERGDAVPYPEGYRGWRHVKSMVIEPGHPLYDSFGGIHHVYANEDALDGLRRSDGRFADGAVFAFDLLEAQSDGAAVTEGERKVLGVMHKDADAFPATGGWGFAGFAGDTRENVVTDPAACYSCHTDREAAGYVFTTLRD